MARSGMMLSTWTGVLSAYRFDLAGNTTPDSLYAIARTCLVFAKLEKGLDDARFGLSYSDQPAKSNPSISLHPFVACYSASTLA